MRFLATTILVALLAFASGSHFFTNKSSEDFLGVTTPKEYALHLQNRLNSNESRLISKKCLQFVHEYRKSLLQGKLWALKMFDARAKFPSGFLRGNGGSLGSFDQCLNVITKDENLGTIRGKYCLGVLQMLDLRKERMEKTEFLNNTSLEPEQRMLNLVEATFGLPWGACLPDVCSAQDFRFLHFFILRFPEENCQTKASQSVVLDDADIAAVIFLAIIAALIITSTMYDVVIHYKQKEPGSVLLRSFSIITNGSRIINYRETDKDITCLHGIRALTLILLTAGYRFFVHLFAPLNNWLDMARWLVNTAAFLEGAVVLDTYFVITGMLISYNYLKSKEKGVRFNLFLYYLNRIMRLTPAFAVVILIHTTLLRHIGSGPVWPQTRDSLLVNNCRKHWWSALLYIQNYVNPGLTEICVLQSWQLSVDIQLFLLSPLILIPLTIVPKYTLATIGGLLFCSILSPFLAAWVYDLKSVIITFRSVEDVGKYIRHFFFPTHTRTVSWIIGFLLGYLIYVTKKTKIQLPIRKELVVLLNTSLWVASFGIIIMCIIIGDEVSRDYNWIIHALHMALIRPIWSLAISWIIFSCVHGYGGLINSFLSLPSFQVISRISYGTYLVNLTLMFILTYQTRTGLDFSNFQAIYKCCGDVVFSLALGFVWTIAFESPAITISKVMFGKLQKNKLNVPDKEDSDIKNVDCN